MWKIRAWDWAWALASLRLPWSGFSNRWRWWWLFNIAIPSRLCPSGSPFRPGDGLSTRSKGRVVNKNARLDELVELELQRARNLGAYNMCKVAGKSAVHVDEKLIQKQDLYGVAIRLVAGHVGVHFGVGARRPYDAFACMAEEVGNGFALNGLETSVSCSPVQGRNPKEETGFQHHLLTSGVFCLHIWARLD